mmetsp:Transcript_19200/g.43691  ORF Transcript_19200/g.43691 Transcript_19200/m.43691 type:complete len:729 (-) Transcript_19200:88-2274(-)
MRLHEDITNVFFLESNLRSVLSESLDSVETISDVWGWLKGPFIEDFFVQKDLYGQPLPQHEWSRVRTYSQVQSTVKLMQSRSSSAPWGVQLSNPDNYTAALQVSQEGFLPLSASHGRQLTIVRPELLGALPKIAGKTRTYEFVLYPTMPVSEIRQRLEYLEDRKWLDQETDTLTINVLLLNAELGRPRLEEVNINLFFSRGGGVFFELALKALFLEAHDTMVSKAADLLWIAMLMGNTALFFWQLRPAQKGPNGGALRPWKLGPRTVLEAMIIAFGWGMVGSFCFINYSWIADVTSKLEDVMSVTKGTGPAGLSVTKASEDLHIAAHTFKEFNDYYQLWVAWYNLLLMFRFFLAFRAHARLAIVINTLQAVGVDLFHFLVVFMPTFLAYMISGNLLFGRRLANFSTLQASFGTCFRIVIENEFEWGDLSEEHFWTTAIWIWSFLLLVVLVMLNMVLAIILDIYNEVRQSMDVGDSIFEFLIQAGKRLYHTRRWIRDSELEGSMSQMEGSATITKSDLLEMFPELTRTQADMLFHASRDHMLFKLNHEMHRATLLKVTGQVKAKVESTNLQVRNKLQEKIDNVECAEEQQHEDDVSPLLKTPETQAPCVANRLIGNNRPFPGMPKAPGGHFPPLLSPSHASNEMPDLSSQPEWLRELHKSMDHQEQWMAALHGQLEELQWMWHAKQKVGMSAMMRKMAEKQQGAEDDEGNDSGEAPDGPVHTPGGARIL